MKKPFATLFVVLVAGLPLTACDSKPDPAKTDPSASASASTSASAPASGSAAVPEDASAGDGGVSAATPSVPADAVTEADFEEEADQIITEANAEDELTKIEKEIGL